MIGHSRGCMVALKESGGGGEGGVDGGGWGIRGMGGVVLRESGFGWE